MLAIEQQPRAIEPRWHISASRAVGLVMAVVAGTPLTFEQKVGAAIAIGGVLIYSVIDDFLAPAKGKKKTK